MEIVPPRFTPLNGGAYTQNKPAKHGVSYLNYMVSLYEPSYLNYLLSEQSELTPYCPLYGTIRT